MNKHQKRCFVEQAANKLGVAWSIKEERETPDFVISEGEREFGLEVSEVFAGPVQRKGSTRKTEESVHQQTIDRYRNDYETRTGLLLHVQILGAITTS